LDNLYAIKNLLKEENNFLITSHIRPDGDAIGSQLALAYLLKRLRKKVTIINQDKIPQHFAFLPDSHLISTNLETKKIFDVAIILDCSEWERIGKVKEIVQSSKIIINIDHHLNSYGLGRFNLLNSQASSVGEMIFQIAKEIPVELDQALATLLYTAILTDTGSFRFSNSNSFTHQIVSELLTHNLNSSKIYNLIYENNPPGMINLLALCLSTLTLFCYKKVALVSLTEETRKESKAEHIETEMVTNLLLSIASVEVAIFIREIKDNMLRINFRSKDKVDVNKLARLFGGGGHKQAAGCTLYGQIDLVQKNIIKEIKKYL